MIEKERATLDLTSADREDTWHQALAAVEQYFETVASRDVNPVIDSAALRDSLEAWTFETPRRPADALDFVLREMAAGQLHTAHPSYYGVFNPRPAALGVVGDMLASAFNPQLASYTSAAFAIEVEQHVLRQFGRLFGYAECEGTFTGGGTEANHTALLVALATKFPTFAKSGVRGLQGAPVLYVSSEGHHSFVKAARMCGLGDDAVRHVPVTADFRMDVSALRAQIERDVQSGAMPFMLVATVGSTGGGIVDPVNDIAAVAEAHGLWLHLDAAWGGAAVILPEMGDLFVGCERSDSLTLDAHKWLSVPMTAGMFITRRRGILEKTFRVDRTTYMPQETASSEKFQPYAQSMGWSRRFLGLKLFLPLSVVGWEGYASVLRHQVAMGELLRATLLERGWRVLNPTRLPVVCFVDRRPLDVEAFAAEVARTGRAWITTTHLGDTPVLRAGIASFATEAEHVLALADTLDEVRRA